MPEAIYRVMTLVCALVVNLPIGTNLGVLHLLWMVVSGRLPTTRGAVIPGNGCLWSLALSGAAGLGSARHR
jgi:hypothetical protein